MMLSGNNGYYISINGEVNKAFWVENNDGTIGIFKI